MYKQNTVVVSAEGMEIVLNCETVAKDNAYGKWYFNCSKCKNFVNGDDTGTQWDCNNYGEVEDFEKTKKGHSKFYCSNYERSEK